MYKPTIKKVSLDDLGRTIQTGHDSDVILYLRQLEARVQALEDGKK